MGSHCYHKSFPSFKDDNDQDIMSIYYFPGGSQTFNDLTYLY
jgi:hypothetical protein